MTSPDPTLRLDGDLARRGPRVGIDTVVLTRTRTERNLSQTELGQMIGVSKNTISSLETGRTSPRLGTAEALCRALGLHIEDLLGAVPEFRPPRQPMRGHHVATDVV